MIFDALDNASQYFREIWWDQVTAFLRSANPLLADGEHLLQGREIIARVHTGQTQPRANALLESHQSYMDVHVVLEGQETIAVWPTAHLLVRTPYNPSQDVAYYHPPPDEGLLLTLSPGFFAVFFPQDAHMTQIASGAPAQIKKLVMKVAVELIGG